MGQRDTMPLSTDQMNNANLKGRNALVTGASKGLGRAMALALAKNGARIALVSRDREKLESVAREVGEAGAPAGGAADVFVADITNEDQVARVEKEVTEKIGKVQILINNAG